LRKEERAKSKTEKEKISQAEIEKDHIKTLTKDRIKDELMFGLLRHA